MTARTNLLAIGTAALVAVPAAGQAATSQFRAALDELNASGVSGTVDFFVDDVAQTLRVEADIAGLEPGQLHVNHIHGRFEDDGSPRNSVTPTMADDTDGDGFVEVLEGLPGYGDILLSLEESPRPGEGNNHLGPFAEADGSLRYELLYDLTDSAPFFSTVTGTDFDAEDLFPLDLREYVIHGLTVPGGVSDDLPDGGYLATLPVAAAQIAPIPVPAAGLLLLGALGGLGLLRRRA